MKYFIVLVNFNGGKKVGEVVKRYTGYKDCGVIVVDNGSTDGSEKGIKGVIKNGKNLGFAAGVNIGIKEALKRGAERVLLVNLDVEIDEAAVRKLFRSEADVVAPVLKFRRDGKWVYDFGGKINWMLGRTYHCNDKKEIEYVSGACVAVKREIFEKIGFFDERFFMYFEDVDFCLRAKRAGFRVAVDCGVTVEHEISEHRKTSDLLKKKYLWESNRRFIVKWVPAIFWPLSYSYLWFLRWRSGL